MDNDTNEISPVDAARVLSNDPQAANVTATLGDRSFPIVDLPYDDYVAFLAHLEPVFKAVGGALVPKLAGVEGLNAASLLKSCSTSLPEMVRLIAKQTHPDITVDEVKAKAGSPFKLANIVLMQVEQNRIIAEISDFFVQVLPLMKSLKKK